MQVDFCRGGKEAIDAIILKHYDLVFMDHKMPDVDGVEATGYIRSLGYEEPYFENIPIVALTANAVSGTREMFLANGFNDYMSKPIDTVKLNSVLEKWIPKEKQKIPNGRDIEIEEINEENNDIVIEGLDVSRGIYLSGGTTQGYLQILGIYYKDGLEKIKELTNCLEKTALPLYTIHVHALKSASANIGAAEVSAAARALELAGEQNDLDYIQSHHGAFITALETLLVNINNALSAHKKSSEEEESPYDIEILSDNLAVLKAALDILDAGTINRTVDELRTIAKDDKIGVVINDISDKVLFGEYDEAVTLIDSLLLEINSGTH
jgi:CheY-like chemotaxis protein